MGTREGIAHGPPFKDSLSAAVEEEGYMGILLCFSDSQLLKTHRADIFAELRSSLLFKCDTYIRHFRIILCVQTKCTGKYSLGKLEKSGSTKVRVIWRARSGRKFMKMIESFSRIPAFLTRQLAQ